MTLSELYYLTLNISETVGDTNTVTMEYYNRDLHTPYWALLTCVIRIIY